MEELNLIGDFLNASHIHLKGHFPQNWKWDQSEKMKSIYKLDMNKKHSSPGLQTVQGEETQCHSYIFSINMDCLNS